MIVIATNNGHICLSELLNSMTNIDICNEKILIIDTISDDVSSIDYLKQVNSLYPKLDITIETTPYRGFDTGAYIYAYNEYNVDTYIFLHDSVTISNKNFIKDIHSYLRTHDVVAYNCFDFMGNGDGEWQTFFEQNTGRETYKMGIFGPMFACNRVALDGIKVHDIIIPTNKNQQTCFEGIWYTLFDENNIDVFPLDMYVNKFTSNYLTKKLLIRH